MVRCCVNTCKSDSGRKLPGLSFHSFPSNNDIKMQWIEATGRINWQPKPTSRICSIHFDKELLIKKKSHTFLMPNAVPQLVCKSIHLQPTTSSQYEEHMEIEHNFPQCSSNTDAETKLATILPTREDKSHQLNETEMTISSSPSYTPRTMKNKLQKKTQQSKDRLKKLRALREKSRRLSNKVVNLKNIIAELKAKSLLSDEDGDMLESIDPMNNDFFKKFLCPSTNVKKYSPNLRKFALCLNFISPRAYKYVRESFKNCLPHPSTLTSWYRSIDANPGFTSESLNCIQLLAKSKDKQLFCALSMDEMAIRRHVQWDGEKCIGLVNYGESLDGYNVAEASQALVFMVTSVNDSWKIPVGYFFIDGCNGEQKANLVTKCINLLFDCGVNVISLTFDGCPSNFKMAEKLGCRFNNTENITPFFEISGHDILIIPDPSHMLKLIRNTLGQKKELVSACGKTVAWHYIENLHKLQENEGLHLANRLKKQHIDYTRQIMKVKLAAQIFSTSVAKAIHFCDQELKLPDFVDSGATVEFIMKINNLFDVFNSRNLHAYDFKKPINEKNGNKILEYLCEAEAYIKGLKLEGRSVLTSNRKVGFLGFLICIYSLRKIFDDYITTGKLKFLSFYKLSQDHLEYFFSAIRAKGGFNNNPTGFQFQNAYRKLVVHGEIKNITSGNCLPLEDIKILTHNQVRYEKKINVYTKCTTEEENNVEDLNNDLIIDNHHDYLADPSRLSLYTEEIIPYIGGFVVKKLLKSLKCEEYLIAIVSEKFSGLIAYKDKGGLNYPSRDVINICMMAERIFKKEIIRGLSFFAEKNIMIKLITPILKRSQTVFINDHFKYQPLVGNHRILLIKAIAARYFEIRIHHATKKFAPNVKIRNIHSKLVLFKGQ